MGVTLHASGCGSQQCREEVQPVHTLDAAGGQNDEWWQLMFDQLSVHLFMYVYKTLYAFV